MYRDVLKLAQKLGISRIIKICKTKIVEMNLKSSDSYKEISVETNVPAGIQYLQQVK